MLMNPTGIKPVEYKVLVKVDEVINQSSGGIWLPDVTRDREQAGNDRGILVDVGGMAFSDWRGKKPNVGDKVIFGKYAGSVIMFKEDRTTTNYRLCNDKDICGIIVEE